MKVVMCIGRTFQDAGRERVLSVGEVYDLPPVVATALIATGAAAQAPLDEAEHTSPRSVVVPEVKPFVPPEIKRRSA